MNNLWHTSNIWRSFTLFSTALSLSACSTLGGTGPNAGTIRNGDTESYAQTGIQIVELNQNVASSLNAYQASNTFAQVFGPSDTSSTLIGPGDFLDITIWEAPPAVLLGSTAPGADIAGNTGIPQQQVGEDGQVTIPFVGRIKAAGLQPKQIEAIIVSRLKEQANDPQALVRLVRNESRTVTILGTVAQNRRINLSARGERVLDALADAGGSRNPIEQSTIQLARGSVQVAMPLDRVIADPDQNIRLRPNDVITLQHQPFSFVALGAVGRNAEVPFEGGGISLAEALGRVGGLNERRADIKGVFVFRMEEKTAAAPLLQTQPQVTADGRVPVIYSLRMDDAKSLFAMQDFQMRDSDVLYIATAPGVELERFITTLSSTAFSIVATANLLGNE